MKKKVIINSILIFTLCSLIHFLYDIVPCKFISIIAPVNESIFEHLKLIFTADLIYTFISNFYYKNNNLFVRTFTRAIITISVLLVIYLPTRAIFGEKMHLTLIILFLSILISEIIVNKVIKKYHNILNIISIFLIIINYIIFGYFTYHPIKNQFFYDTKNKKYGIDIIK